MPHPVLTKAIDRLAQREDLETAEAEEVLATIMAGEAGEAQIAAFLIALRTKGETAEELAGLAQAMRTLPTGTAYAVWVGIGASLTVLYAMYTGTEPVTLARALFLSLIIIGIIGLKVAT